MTCFVTPSVLEKNASAMTWPRVAECAGSGARFEGGSAQAAVNRARTGVRVFI
jgi:hypothetical protein